MQGRAFHSGPAAISLAQAKVGLLQQGNQVVHVHLMFKGTASEADRNLIEH